MRRNRYTFSYHGLLLFFTFLWGANFILAEIALYEMAPIAFSVSRFAIGGVAMCLMLYYRYYKEMKRNRQGAPVFPSVDKEDRPRLIFISIIGAALAPWLGIVGLGLTYGARASLWLALGPVVSVGFGTLWSTEKLQKTGYAGIFLAAAGTLILALSSFRQEAGYWLGDLLLIIALILTVIELHLIKPLARKYGSTQITTQRTIIGCSVYLLIAMPSLLKQPWLSLSFWTWFAILAGGAVGVGIGMWVQVSALHKLGPTKVVLYSNMVPVAAMFVAWLSIGTDPTLFDIISAAFIVSGAVLLQLFDRSKSEEQEEVYAG